MAKDDFIPVHKSGYIQELEDRVAYWVAATPDLPPNKRKRVRQKMPKGLSARSKSEWEIDQIEKCRYGHDGVCGKMYFWFNFCYIQNIKGGKIEPEYRECDHHWFRTLEEEEAKNGSGIVCVKRRRVGMSWKAAADMVYDAIFRPFSFTGANSKTERDSVVLFKKVQFIFDNLPDFMKVRVGARSQSRIEFYGKEPTEHGGFRITGNQSAIMVVAPTPTAFEGQMLSKWICDEAGKIPHMEQLWSYTEDTMMQETVRAGFPVIFGTSGEVGKEGRGLVEMWDNANIYGLKRFFFGGWMGIAVDEMGNDRKEEAIRWIIYERARRSNLSAKSFNDFIQRYPLSPSEAFSQASEGGLGNIQLINRQMQGLREEPIPQRKGTFNIKDDKISFNVGTGGNIIMYEDYDPTAQYIAGMDPADHENVGKDSSELATYIIKRPSGVDGPKIVMEYVDRPKKLKEYFYQTGLALRYFGNTRVLVENNRYRAILEFEEMGLKHLLAPSPQLNKYVRTNVNTPGIRMTPQVKDYMEQLIEEYIEDYVGYIPSIELLMEFIKYGTDNTDRAMAFGIGLIQLNSDKQRANAGSGDDMKGYLPTKSYRMVGGKIVRV